jgi:hypothetical protein
MARYGWVFNPHAGGKTIPPDVRARTERRIRAYADKRYTGKFTRLDVRFRGALCYIDAYTDPPEPSPALLKMRGETRQQYLDRLRSLPLHLCRLRYNGREDAWTVAFYTYSHERYEPSIFPNGTFYGTPEEAFELSAVYLQA